jgi:hypothetical protein
MISGSFNGTISIALSAGIVAGSGTAITQAQNVTEPKTGWLPCKQS